MTLLPRRGEIKRGRALLSFYLVIAAVTVLLSGAEAVFRNRRPVWKTYREHRAVRSVIVDYARYYPSREEAREQYMAAGRERSLYRALPAERQTEDQ